MGGGLGVAELTCRHLSAAMQQARLATLVELYRDRLLGAVLCVPCQLSGRRGAAVGLPCRV